MRKREPPLKTTPPKKKQTINKQIYMQESHIETELINVLHSVLEPHN